MTPMMPVQQRIRSRGRRASTAAALVLFLGVLAGCGNRGSGDSEEVSGPATVPVTVAPVVRKDVDETVSAPGATVVLRRQSVHAPVSGRILSLRALEYQTVSAGDTLAIIRLKEAQSAIDGAAAMRQAAKTPEQEAEAQRAQELATSLGGEAAVTASIDGVVSTRSVAEGDLVVDDAVLMEIVDPSTICFLADVPIAGIGRVRNGQPCAVTFAVLGDEAFPGAIDALSPSADRSSQTVGARIRFTGTSARSALRPDMAGTVRIVVGVHRGALVVPASSVQTNDETASSWVMVVSPDSLAVPVPVVVGGTTPSGVEVSSAELREGVMVISDGNYALPESTKVNPSPR